MPTEILFKSNIQLDILYNTEYEIKWTCWKYCPHKLSSWCLVSLLNSTVYLGFCSKSGTLTVLLAFCLCL